MNTDTIKMTTCRLARALLAVTAISISGYAQGQANDPQATSQIVERYEAVSEALVQDDLSAAQQASSELVATAKEQKKKEIERAAGKVAAASSLEEARDSFKSLSSKVIELAKGNDEYTVMTCPMVENGLWLQTDEQVANPYMGQKMPKCGMPASKKGMMMDGMMKKEGMQGMNGKTDGPMMKCASHCCRKKGAEA